MTKVHHVALFVSDMDRARYLFQDILGFGLAWHAPMIKGRRMAELMGIPDVQMEIGDGSPGCDISEIFVGGYLTELRCTHKATSAFY